MPSMKVRPMTISAMRRKSRRFASDIFPSPNGGQLARLLRARRERPRDRCAAEQRDERAPPYAEHRPSSFPPSLGVQPAVQFSLSQVQPAAELMTGPWADPPELRFYFGPKISASLRMAVRVARPLSVSVYAPLALLCAINPRKAMDGIAWSVMPTEP